MLKLGVNAEARRFSEPGAGIPHAGIFGGAGGQLPVLRYRAPSTARHFFLGASPGVARPNQPPLSSVAVERATLY